MTLSRRGLGFDLAVGLAAFLVLAVLPQVWPSKQLVDFVIRGAALALFATSLNLLVGYAGMVSFGHAMFFALGAYSFGLLLKLTGIGIPAAFALTLIITAVVSILVGVICIRLNEIYFSFLTLAFQMLLHSLIIAWVPLTGGDQGLTGGIPRPVFLGINLANQGHLYVFACAMLVAGLLIMRHIVESPFGYTLRIIRDNALRARFLGIDATRVRLVAFLIAGIFAAVGGIIMSLFVSGAYPEFAYWTMSGEGIFIIMLGGLHTFLGPTVGTIILLLLNDVVTRMTEHYGLVLGIVILLFALGLRKGLTDFLLDLWRARRGRVAAAKAGA